MAVTEPVAPIDPAIGRQAVEWLVELQSEPVSEASRQAWAHWLAAHPEHRRAWQRIEAMNGRLAALPPGLARSVLDAPASPARRRALKTLGIAAAVGCAGWSAERGLPWQAWVADERTAVGERRTVVLPDGTHVILNTDSAIDVRFDASRRGLRLLRGEIMVTTAHPMGETRPFDVDAGNGRLRPLGTRFSVRRMDDVTQLAVLEGRVDVRTADAPDEPHLVRAGEGTRFTRASVAPVVAIDENGSAWVDGMLVARDMPLADVIAEVARYRAGHVACASTVAGLRVSGTYPLADTDRIFAILAKSLPIDVRYRTRYWVSLVPRET